MFHHYVTARATRAKGHKLHLKVCLKIVKTVLCYQFNKPFFFSKKLESLFVCLFFRILWINVFTYKALNVLATSTDYLEIILDSVSKTFKRCSHHKGDAAIFLGSLWVQMPLASWQLHLWMIHLTNRPVFKCICSEEAVVFQIDTLWATDIFTGSKSRQCKNRCLTFIEIAVAVASEDWLTF